ncbi:rod shape-determining protein MreD [Oceanispirochaeta crateris]|uniref:Rod shape-determining protein MreD n=1 Tax=Oceanispirochaeta crateris TaxID=2518645 RepID=A0A5C1QKU1_9SPIO|nr:rod shape-determining protein MreD [Oceanispirochaeta crateris]QEN07560.1 rod shape-determining protein MreD [Oceanispirochaeta crateris]
MKKSLTILFLMIFSILIKTTLSRYLSLSFGTPDITLIILVCISIRYGSVTGQLTGFTTGLMEDFLSLSPLGFNSLIRTIIGFLTGLFHDRLIMDPVLFPILSVSLTTLLKGALSYLILEIFKVEYSGSIFITTSFGFELLMNALLAPFLFQMIKVLFDVILKERKTL